MQKLTNIKEMKDKGVKIKSKSEIVFEIVSCIPYGKVANYGLVNDVYIHFFSANLTPLGVGHILSSMQDFSTCPWHRVVAKNGEISSLKLGLKGDLQIKLLKKEAVSFVDNKVDMKNYSTDKNRLITIYNERVQNID